MKYAIYDKVASGYLTKMEFEVGYSEHTQFERGYNDFITDAKLLDTPKEAADAIVRIESFKFMDKGRFVMHSFDDTLKDHYIISEAGKPTKVVDNIAVNIDGTIDVKYGTMALHWSTEFLEYAINRMNALQKAKDPRYTAWCNTFDIYKVITVIDEKSCPHYQFIRVTNKGLEKYAKDEEVVSFNERIDDLKRANDILTEDINYHNDCRLALVDMIRAIKYAIYSKDGVKRDNYISYMTDKIKDDEIFNRPELKTAKTDIPKICKHLAALAKNPLNKRIEELEKANYDLGERKLLVEGVANRLQEENDDLKIKVEAIKEEANNWKKLYENADSDRKVLKDIIDIIYTDFKSSATYDELKRTRKALEHNSDLEHITMPTEASHIFVYRACLTAKDEICFIIDQILTIMESRELNQSVAFASADEVNIARGAAWDIISICEEDSEFEITLKKFSQLYEALHSLLNIYDNPIIHAFDALLLIFSTMDRKLKEFVDEIYEWKSKAQKAEKDLDDQKKLNDANKATIAQMVVEKSTTDKEIKKLRGTRGSMAEVIFAIRNAIYNNNNDAFRCIDNRMLYDSIFNSDPFMAGVRENILDICNAYEKNIANHELKDSDIVKAADALKEVNDKNEGLSNMLKEISCRVVDIMYATKERDHNVMISKLEDISNEIGVKFSDDGPIYCISVILNAFIRIAKEGTDWMRRAEKFKGIANSVYGITMADILNGKKIPINKDKYDDLVECVNNINITYDILKCADLTMDKPLWFEGIINRIKNLTE